MALDSKSSTNNRRCLGFLQRKEVWTLTWRARVLLLLVIAGLAIAFVLNVHDFLAVNAPVNSRVLVVEGWIPEYALTNFIAHHANYSTIYTIGGPTLTDLHSRDVSDTYASVARGYLVKLGVDPARVQMVPHWHSIRDRTYSAALALRDWCQTNHVQLTDIDLVTMGSHARRSRLLTQQALGSEVRVGIIPLVNETYDSNHWWRYSEGVKEIISEGAAYLYALFLFSPD